MNVVLNGEPTSIPDGLNVRQLIAHLGLDTQPTAVEVNKSLVPRREHERRMIGEGDCVEVVTLVGGG